MPDLLLSAGQLILIYDPFNTRTNQAHTIKHKILSTACEYLAWLQDKQSRCCIVNDHYRWLPSFWIMLQKDPRNRIIIAAKSKTKLRLSLAMPIIWRSDDLVSMFVWPTLPDPSSWQQQTNKHGHGIFYCLAIRLVQFYVAPQDSTNMNEFSVFTNLQNFSTLQWVFWWNIMFFPEAKINLNDIF